MPLKQSKRLLLIKYVNGICEICHKKFEDKDLIAHHLNRSCMNGSNSFRNIEIICKKCSKRVHYRELYTLKIP